MTSEVRRRAPFELLAFTAAPVAGGLVVVELEGRFAQNGRFTRQPLLVVESGAEEPRLQLAPVRATLVDGLWRSAYAIPAEALPDARFALGVRGTLLELPAPDEPDETDRLTALAREANALRRALEAAETAAALAHSEVAATSAELGAAVLAARDEALAESTDQISTLTTSHEQAITAAQAQIAAAEQRAEEAEARARAAQEGAAELANIRTLDADARALAAEQTAQTAIAGTEVLRAELAEERERSATAITQLEAQLDAARRRADALRNAAEAEAAAVGSAPGVPGGDEVGGGPLAGADHGGDEAGRSLAAADEVTHALAAVDRDADATAIHRGADRDADPTIVQRPAALSGGRHRAGGAGAPVVTHHAAPRGVGPWIAVGALLLFAFVLLGLLLGFLA